MKDIYFKKRYFIPWFYFVIFIASLFILIQFIEIAQGVALYLLWVLVVFAFLLYLVSVISWNSLKLIVKEDNVIYKHGLKKQILELKDILDIKLKKGFINRLLNSADIQFYGALGLVFSAHNISDYKIAYDILIDFLSNANIAQNNKSAPKGILSDIDFKTDL